MSYSTIRNIRLLHNEYEVMLTQQRKKGINIEYYQNSTQIETDNIHLNNLSGKPTFKKNQYEHEMKYSKFILNLLKLQGIDTIIQIENIEDAILEEYLVSEFNLLNELTGTKRNITSLCFSKKNSQQKIIEFRNKEDLRKYNHFLESIPKMKYAYHDVGQIFELNYSNLAEYLLASEILVSSIHDKNYFDSIELLEGDNQKILLERILIHRLCQIEIFIPKTKIVSLERPERQIDEALFHPVILKEIRKQLNLVNWQPVFSSDLEKIEYLGCIRERISIPKGIELLPNIRYLSFIACGLEHSNFIHETAYVDICLNDEGFDLIEQKNHDPLIFRLMYNRMKLLQQYSTLYDEYLLYLEKLEEHEYSNFLKEIYVNEYDLDWKEKFEIRKNWLLKNSGKVRKAYFVIETLFSEIIYLESKIHHIKLCEEINFRKESYALYREEKNYLQEKFILLLTEYTSSNLMLKTPYKYQDLPDYKKIIKIDSKNDLKKIIKKCVARKNLLLEYNSRKKIIAYLELLESKKELIQSKERALTGTHVAPNIILNRNAIHPEIVKEIYKINGKEDWEPLTMVDCYNIESLSFVNKKIMDPFGVEFLKNLRYISFVACGIDKNCERLQMIEYVDIISNNTVL